MPCNPIPSPEQFALLTAQRSARGAVLAERESEVAQLRETIATLEHTLTVRTLEIEEIELQLSILRRSSAGNRRNSSARSTYLRRAWKTCWPRKARLRSTHRWQSRPGIKRYGGHCRHAVNATCRFMSRWNRHARNAAANSSPWAKTFRSSSIPSVAPSS